MSFFFTVLPLAHVSFADKVCEDITLADHDNYLAYTQNSLVGASPMHLVIALYEGAIETVRQAKKCFLVGDILGRGAAITRATNILTELMVSLDMEKGGEISLNLKKLYDYMQQRLLSAHLKREVEPMAEVERLLMDMLEGWNTVARQTLHESPQPVESLPVEDCGELIVAEKEEEVTYTGYFLETGASVLGQAYSF